MKKNITFLLIFIFLSCGEKNLYRIKKDMEIFNKYELGEFTFFECVNTLDTTVFVANTLFYKKCKKHINYINIGTLKQISSLKIINDTFYFKYSIPSVNGEKLIETGEFSPLENKTNIIRTYSKYPYYVEDCKAFISK